MSERAHRGPRPTLMANSGSRWIQDGQIPVIGETSFRSGAGWDRTHCWLLISDRYILKLFRDYVFHSMGVDGKPVLDLSHVLTSLNKVGDTNQRSGGYALI